MPPPHTNTCDHILILLFVLRRHNITALAARQSNNGFIARAGAHSRRAERRLESPHQCKRKWLCGGGVGRVLTTPSSILNRTLERNLVDGREQFLGKSEIERGYAVPFCRLHMALQRLNARNKLSCRIAKGKCSFRKSHIRKTIGRRTVANVLSYVLCLLQRFLFLTGNRLMKGPEEMRK